MDRLLRSAIKSLVPNWLSNVPGLNVSFKVLYAIALVSDVIIENGYQGFLATLPGVGTATALPLHGQTRGLLQGPNEPNASFAARLLRWQQSAQNLGSDEELVHQIQAFMTPSAGPLPTVRIVNRAGGWVTANPDGSTSTTVDTAWNWDGVLNPERASWWSDHWIIVTPSPFATYANTSDPAWTGAWARYDGSALGAGHQVPRQYVDGILSIVDFVKGAHAWVQAIVWVAPANGNGPLFVPGNLGLAGNPDGTWGHWSKNVGGTQVPARTTAPVTGSGGGSVRYWEPPGGG